MANTLIGCTVQPENIAGVILLENGKVVNKVVDRSNQFFDKLVAAIKNKDNEEICKYLLGFTPVLQTFADAGHAGVVKVEHGVVTFNGIEINNALTARMLRMLNEGFDIEPMRLFLTNLMANPSSTAVAELYLFLEANQLSLTDDGHFLAYKSVNANFESIHTNPDGTRVDNSVGSKPSMPRNMVDDNRNRTCSTGLHFASLDYCKNSYTGDQIVALKINPRDVVSIPSDYNNQKGRACAYEVIAIVTDEVKTQHRDPLSEKAVVSVGGFSNAKDATWDNQKTLAENLRTKAEQQIGACKTRLHGKQDAFIRDTKGRFVKKA